MNLKHQTPNTKLQKSSKLQAPNLAGGRSWCLAFGVFLELGVWSLVFLYPWVAPVCFP